MRRAAGVALITVMLVVAIATLAATALLSASSIAIHRTAALRDTEQAWWIAGSVEAWVMGLLKKYKQNQTSDYDALDETPPVDNLPVDDFGYVRGALFDAQGRFNLNNLARNVDVHHDYQRQFELLLQGNPKLQPPQGLVASIQDWIDDDDMPAAGGAEDSFYMEQTPPYRAANRPFKAVSELLAIQGMTPELYAVLRDLVTVLPETTRVNVNTAPIPVLIAMGVDPTKVDQWDSQRKQPAGGTDSGPVTDAGQMAEFVRKYLVAGKPDYLAYQTSYFLLQGDVFVGSGHVSLYSLIHRQGPGTPAVLAHSADAE